ncbi:MAG: cellulase family glycosylhydrolase [Candidatus Marinimicrobia bacterium]|nr:cellulase family glycosylhydrolase [Candidatus Neomarinimicrobiota bacterium]
MKRYFLMIAILNVLLFQSVFGFFKTRGMEILDLDENPIILQGYGLGGWLVPEGYMLHIPGYGSPTSIRNRILELIGEEATYQFFDLYRKNYVAEKDIELIADWGFNSIRLPFHYQFFSPIDSPGVFIDDGFEIIDTLLVWCKKNNLYLILDMHCAPGGQNSGNISDSDGEAKLWTIPSNQDRTIEIWKRIAERYVSEEWIIGYDLLNEPVLPSEYNGADLRDLYIRLTDAIREVDPNHIIFIEGNWYATDFSGLTPRFDSNMVYAFHKYWNETDLASIQSYRNMRTQSITPLWLGETGENSNPWFYETVKLMDQQNIGWNWWAHKKFNTITSPLSAFIPSGYQQIIDYWKGNAAKPSAEFARAALVEMASNLELDKCEFHSDVIAALMDPDFGTSSKPFKIHIVPGSLMTVDYDFGTNGVAYNDVDYKKIRRDEDQPWNRGYAYRNDGVDIEKSATSVTGEYNIGWIEDSEWVNYTVEIVYTGKYNIDIRVASTSNNGRLQLILDNQVVVNSIEIPNTGGWYNWQTITVEDINLPKGTHTLRVNFIKGGFNLQRMIFTAVDNSLIEKITTYLYIGKNYPNPFNDQTIIPIVLTKPSLVKLNIFDLQGKLIRNLYNGEMIRGLNELFWDGTDNANVRVSAGVYYYRITVDSTATKVKPMLYLK